MDKQNHPMTLLLVEDKDSEAMPLSVLLTQHGKQVVRVCLLAEAFRELREGLRPAVALVDLKLPDGRGEKLIARLLALDPPVKVIVTTGLHDEDRVELLRHIKGVKVITKPIDVKMLMYLIDVV